MEKGANMAVDYKFYDIKLVKQNQKKLIKDAIKAHDRFQFAYGKFLKEINSTSFFRYYSFVSLSAGSSAYYLLFKEIQKNIRSFYKKKGPLWFQCWLNLHKQDEVLEWHNHQDCAFHGYISIDPKNTETEFKNFTVKNEVGKMYLGPAYEYHKVNVLSPFKGQRITIAFDVVNTDSFKAMEIKYGPQDINTGYIPIW